MTIEEFKLAAVSTDFSDAEVKKLLKEVKITDKKDVHELVTLLRKHRPQIYQELDRAYAAHRSRPK